MSDELTNPIIVEVDCSTGIAVERPMTEQEAVDHARMQEHAIAAIAEREQAQSAQQEALISAQTKLVSLGLTAEEIAAITGQPINPVKQA